jgi:hypothetical protein
MMTRREKQKMYAEVAEEERGVHREEKKRRKKKKREEKKIEENPRAGAGFHGRLGDFAA